MTQRFAVAPWLFPERSGALRPAGDDEPVDSEDDESADDGCDEARALARVVPADCMADPAGKQRTGDAEQDSDNAAARVAAGHQKLRNSACEPTDDDPADDAILFHRASPYYTVVQPTVVLSAATRIGGTSAPVSRKAVAQVKPAKALPVARGA